MLFNTHIISNVNSLVFICKISQHWLISDVMHAVNTLCQNCRWLFCTCLFESCYLVDPPEVPTHCRLQYLPLWMWAGSSHLLLMTHPCSSLSVCGIYIHMFFTLKHWRKEGSIQYMHPQTDEVIGQGRFSADSRKLWWPSSQPRRHLGTSSGSIR